MKDQSKTHYEVHVRGRVQGVGLRYSAKATANQLHIQGYARNLPDGRVRLELEGSPQALEQFMEWLKSNPGLSEIQAVEVSQATPKGHEGFRIF